jgi:hypothetical protein
MCFPTDPGGVCARKCLIFRLFIDERALRLFNTRLFEYGQVAQLVEQRTENPRVGGSIPSLATNKSFIFLVVTTRADFPNAFGLTGRTPGSKLGHRILWG